MPRRSPLVVLAFCAAAAAAACDRGGAGPDGRSTPSPGLYRPVPTPKPPSQPPGHTTPRPALPS